MAATRINTPWTKFVSHANDIGDLIGEVSEERLRKAGKHTAGVMRRNLGSTGTSSPGGYPAKRTGYLQKKTGYTLVKTVDDPYVKVGSKSPHAHLLEFGHGDGKSRNKRPFISRSFDEAGAEVLRILSKAYF